MSDNFFYNAYLNYLKLQSSDDYDIKDKLNTQRIGYFDTDTNIWYNGWTIYSLNIDKNDIHKKSKELLMYALNLENNLTSYSKIEKMIIKSTICNSKIYITDYLKNDKNILISNSLQLEIILSVICYLTKAKKIIHYFNNNIFIFEIIL
jgi:hypothetical protein